ncbi:thioredoxin-like protein, partial [Usnea florida]
DEDALLDSLETSLENDPSLAHLREARLQQLSSELKASKHLRSQGFGSYDQIKDEKPLMDITTSTKYCVVHFYKPDFNRCRIMDGHLSALAAAHLSTRFLRIDVEHAPFLVAKLNVKVLPCVIAFVDGVSVDRIVGFEGVGYSEDTFKTADLEKRLLGAGVLEK